jgi:hypothetical protein
MFTASYQNAFLLGLKERHKTASSVKCPPLPLNEHQLQNNIEIWDEKSYNNCMDKYKS